MARTGRPRTEPIKRFMAMTMESPSGCLEWVGWIDRYGYGQFGPGGRRAVKVGAHRWAYEYFIGPIALGMQIDHLCRNRKCVNPDHLEAVTPRENVLRSMNPTAINARKTHCSKGHPLSGQNIHIYGSRRVCKQCKARYDAARYARRKAA